jgi:hypothetical protein
MAKAKAAKPVPFPVPTVGLRRARPHVEVYLSDPRRSKPERLKTVLLGEIEA